MGTGLPHKASLGSWCFCQQAGPPLKLSSAVSICCCKSDPATMSCVHWITARLAARVLQ